jgi:mono/diheme cytochrome c family protein
MTPLRGAGTRTPARDNERDTSFFGVQALRRFGLAAGAALLCAAAGTAEPTGDALFATHCATCHGADGEGGGPVANAMNVTMPNLRTLAKRGGGAFPTDAVAAYIDGRSQVASHGDRLMPVWGDFLQMPGDKGNVEERVRMRIAALIAFIERLQYR